MNNIDDAIDPAQRCGNCRTPLSGPYCHQCGQPLKGLIRPLSGWVADFFDSVFDYDGRLPRTLVPLLFRPGFLTREYIAGRRVRYVTPVRLFLFLTVLLFLAVRLTTHIDINNATADLIPEENDLPRVERIIDWLPEPEQQDVMQTLLHPAIAVEEAAIQIEASPQDDDKPVRIGWLSDSLNDQLNVAIRHMESNLSRVSQNPAQFVEQMLAVAPQTLFFMLPVFALILKLFYLFSRRLYTEHLLVALHSHSFIALTLLLIVLLSYLAGLATGIGWLTTLLGWMGGALLIWIPINLFLAQKRIYGQGWVMTTLKFMVIGILYIMLLTLGSLITLVLSLLLW